MLFSTIIGFLSKFILSIELFLTQFLWSIAIKQGLENPDSYLVWKSFDSNLGNLENKIYSLSPILITIAMAYSGLSLVSGKESNKREILGNASFGIFVMAISTMAMRYILVISYLGSGAILSMSTQWSYYFSDLYVINNIPTSGESTYSLLFFSGIYTLGGISVTLALMLREGIIITLYIFMPVLSFLSFSGKGRELLIKIWIVFLQSALMPIPVLFMIYIYINLNGFYFQQLGMIILISVFPALFPYGVYRAAGAKFSSLPYLIEMGSHGFKNGINGVSWNINQTIGSYRNPISQAYPEGDISRVLQDINLGGNDAEK
jgi:hypothetical protein